MLKFTEEKVLDVHHWTDSLFTIKATRSAGFRFVNGQFVMLGMSVEGRPLLRAYSMASASYEETLEFYSIKVPNGPLTSRLQHIKVGDSLLVGTKPTGTLVTGNLVPGKHLWLLATGTGLAPFLSIIKDYEVYEKFDRVILTHTCRNVADLAYAKFIREELPQNEFFGEMVKKKLVYYPTVTRENFKTPGRITHLLKTGKIFHDLDLPPMHPERDRVMLCGSPEMLTETSTLLEEMGFTEGNSGEPGHYLIEKAFSVK
ncbi:ferredoxin--NADP reductase [Chondromyces crocatus]|uniref:ferredoxin--NADP(+) reductase n=1 Tax=Chondromyces crocatus TaxID=52 RepID=A0A0K1ESE9_CHOCO|nr:ferredoxin--NADP reductase [Chondromyces crocatus]AKT43548.1 ferredoxin--NADP reductase [Chondromyces crocatus]